MDVHVCIQINEYNRSKVGTVNKRNVPMLYSNMNAKTPKLLLHTKAGKMKNFYPFAKENYIQGIYIINSSLFCFLATSYCDTSYAGKCSAPTCTF